MGDHIAFFYGTLMVPGVLYRVIYGSPFPEEWQKGLTKVRPALLHSHERRKVRGADYPAIIPHEGTNVRGTICTGLTDGDMFRLDIFEGDKYNKLKLKVKVLKDEVGLDEAIDESKLDELVIEEVEADTYVWKPDMVDFLEDHEWDFEAFKQKKAKKWLGLQPDEEEVDSGFTDVFSAVAEYNAKQGGDPMGGRGVNGRIGRQLEDIRAQQLRRHGSKEGKT